MDLNKLNNLANAKKTEAEKQKEKERLEQLKKEKEKKDTIDKIQSFFDGTYNSKVISYIKNISDEQLQEQIENLISKDYDSDKYTLDISINFNFIEFEYGENIIDEDLIDENRNIYNKEMNTKLTRKQFIQEAIYDRCINEYWYNYYDFTYDDILIKINNKNINKSKCDYVRLDIYNDQDKNIINNIINNFKVISEKEEKGEYAYETYYTKYYIGKLPNIQEVEDELKTRLEDFGFKIIDIKNNEQLQNYDKCYSFNFKVIIKNPTKE